MLSFIVLVQHTYRTYMQMWALKASNRCSVNTINLIKCLNIYFIKLLPSVSYLRAKIYFYYYNIINVVLCVSIPFSQTISLYGCQVAIYLTTCQFPIGVWPDQTEPSIPPPPPICTLLEKCNLNFRDITWNEEENEILHEIFRVVSRFPTTFPVDYLCNSVEVHVALHHHLGLCTNCTCTACKKPVYCLKYNLNFGVSLHIL